MSGSAPDASPPTGNILPLPERVYTDEDRFELTAAGRAAVAAHRDSPHAQHGRGRGTLPRPFPCHGVAGPEHSGETIRQEDMMSNPRAPDWTVEEFATLLNDCGATDAALAERLSRRTLGAVATVRAALHHFHQSGDSSMLSRQMQQHLAARKGSSTCPVCKARF